MNIGNRAFRYCSGLTSITIPDSMTSIGRSAFSSCSGLTSITIPDSVTCIEEYAFDGCSGLTSVTIGNGVTSIGIDAFDNCSRLTSVTIGNSVTSVLYAISRCSELTSITFEGNIPTNLSGIFSYKSKLRNLKFNGSSAVSDLYKGDFNDFPSCVSNLYIKLDLYDSNKSIISSELASEPYIFIYNATVDGYAIYVKEV